MMKRPLSFQARGRGQRGVTLIVGLVMIVLITMIVVSAFTMSSSNLKAVGNMQARDEATAAANQAIELFISETTFRVVPAARSLNVDINKDGTNDYPVEIARPVCVRAVIAAFEVNEEGLHELASMRWDTEWDISSAVTDPVTGASVTVRQGVKVQLSDTQKSISCP